MAEVADTRRADEDRLPWLEAVEDEDAPRAISGTAMAVGALVVIVLMAGVAGASFYFGRDAGGSGAADVEIIAAPEEPYKVRPEDPGGLDLSSESGTAFATSAGEDPDARLDTSKLGDEQPRIAVAEPEPEPEAPAAAPAPAAPAGPQVQLGAYSTRAKAETGWALLSSQFPEVAALRKNIVEATVNGQRLFRLRAVAADAAGARATCNALDAAGESCVIVN